MTTLSCAHHIAVVADSFNSGRCRRRLHVFYYVYVYTTPSPHPSPRSGNQRQAECRHRPANDPMPSHLVPSIRPCRAAATVAVATEADELAVFRLARRSFPDNGIALSNPMIYMRARCHPAATTIIATAAAAIATEHAYHPRRSSGGGGDVDDNGVWCGGGARCERRDSAGRKHTRTQNPKRLYNRTAATKSPPPPTHLPHCI